MRAPAGTDPRAGAPTSWVIGRGGLLGSNVAASLARRGAVWEPSHPVAWGRCDAADQVVSLAREFAGSLDGAPWQVAWCAGSGVPSTPEDALRAEEQAFAHLLRSLAEIPGPGALFVTSSAGGVYAGSTGPPFTEHTVPVPLAPYGFSKLRIEQAAQRWASDTGQPVVIGRLSNLYGVGQDLSKPQGLVSHLCRGQLTRQPVRIYVSLDTLRDYLWAGDAGELVAHCLERARRRGPDPRSGEVAGMPPAVVKNLVSGQPTSIARLIGELRRVANRPPPVVMVVSAESAWQVRDLRVESTTWPDLKVPITPLPVGISRVFRQLIRLQQDGRLLR